MKFLIRIIGYVGFGTGIIFGVVGIMSKYYLPPLPHTTPSDPYAAIFWGGILFAVGAVALAATKD